MTALPSLGVDVRVAALVGMAAIFAGASRAFLASVIFAFETTRQPLGLLPLLGGSSVAFLVAALLTRTSIMTEKIARRGARVLSDYRTDFLDQALVGECASREVVQLSADDTVARVREWLVSGAPKTKHTGFPVVDANGGLVGVVTRSEFLATELDETAAISSLLRRPPLVILETNSLREAADRMVTHGVGRLVVVDSANPTRILGILTRSDVLGAHRRRLDDATRVHSSLPLGRVFRSRRRASGGISTPPPEQDRSISS